jgi:hypothetical protein
LLKCLYGNRNLFQAGFDNRHVLLDRAAAHPDTRHPFAIANKWQTTAHRAVSASGKPDKRKQRLARLHEIEKVGSAHSNKRGRIRLAFGDIYRKSWGATHTMLEDDIAVNVRDANSHGHFGLSGFRLNLVGYAFREREQIHDFVFPGEM